MANRAMRRTACSGISVDDACSMLMSTKAAEYNWLWSDSAAGPTFKIMFRRCSVSVSSSIDAHDFVVTMLPPPADAASRSMRCKHSIQNYQLWR
jgi:hypothetical protein